MSEQIDTDMENEISDLGLNAPRVTKDHIDELMEKVEFKTSVVEGTTTTLAVAMLDGFTLAIEKTACVDPKNFNAELGAKYATIAAVDSARDKLWELEGWRLKMTGKL